MSRPIRIEYEGAVYHVMNRGLARQEVFLTDEDCAKFLEIIRDAAVRWKIGVYGYALMGNHYHICLETPMGNLSRVMRHIDGVYTQRFNREHERDGPLFRGRYKAILIDSEEYLGQVVRYIHLNPVKAKLVEDPRQYQWSSHGEYMGKRVRHLWLKREKLLASMEGAKGFHQYVIQGNEELIERFYAKGRQSPVLGSKKFIKKVEVKLNEEHTLEERRHIGIGIEGFIEEVRKYYRETDERMRKGNRGEANEARQVLIYLAHEVGDMRYAQIAKEMGLKSYGSASWHCVKVKERIRRDKSFAGRVDELASRVNRRTYQP